MDYRTEEQMKKAKNQNEKDESINGFDRLPYEIATDTLSRLPITSLVQLSYSCRSLHSLSRDPDVVSLHMSKSSTNESECVILHSVYLLQDQLRFICLSDLKVRKVNIPVAISMPKFEIIGSSNGLLCLGDSLFPGSFCLYNPFRRDHLEIPNNFVFRDKFVVYGFGFHPITNDYKVIMIADRDKTYYAETGHRSDFGEPVSDVQIYSVKSNVWLNRGTVPYSMETWSTRGTLVRGRLHWVSRWVKLNENPERTIVTYNLEDDSFDVIYCPAPAPGSSRKWAPRHLANLDGRLSAVVRVRSGAGAFDVWILREYGVSESWVKTYSVGTYCRVPHGGVERHRRAGRIIESVLCVLRSGELLLQYKATGCNHLVTYDPQNMTFRRYEGLGLPAKFNAFFHVGSLLSAAALPLL